MIVRSHLIRARPIFDMISDNANVSLGVVDCSLYTRRIALKDDCHRKRMDMLAYTPVEYNYLETLAKTFIIPARQNQFFHETFLAMLQFFELPMQCKQTLRSLDHILKIHSGINKPSSDKLENSQEVSQS